MATDWPETSDAASVRTEAQRRMPAGNFLVPRGMGEAQGKKVVTPALRLGDRGAAGVRLRSGHRRREWTRFSEQEFVKENWRTSHCGHEQAGDGNRHI